MENRILHLVIALFLTSSYSMIFSQEITTPELQTYLIERYNKDTKKNNGKELTFNKKMLNILFTKEISNYLTESSNLNTRKAFAVLTEEDNRLFLGGSFTNPFKKRRSIDRLIGLNTIGIKADIKDKFATVFSSGDLNNDLGISYKYTYIGRGTITYSSKSKKGKSDKEKIETYRKDYLLDEFLDEKVNESVKTITQKNNKNEVINELNGKPKSKLLNTVSKSDFDALYLSILEEEADNTTKQKWYTNYYNWWVSLETFIPITRTEYKTSENIESNVINTSDYSPFEIEFSGNFFLKTASYGSFQFRGIYEGYNNNSVRAELKDLIKPFSFIEFQQQIDDSQNTGDNTFFAQLDENEVNVGEFKEFFTNGIKGEIVYFLPEKVFGKDLSFIGLSASVEQYFGEYKAKNWRLGIPVVLKDKDGKSTVNFELQWREINKNHSVGFSIGVPFGKFVK